MEFFVKYIKKRTKQPIDYEDHRIWWAWLTWLQCDRWHQVRCLAHVINLATQALIKGYSKAKYYSLSQPDEHIPDVDAYLQDEVGLVCAIAIKVHLFFWSRIHLMPLMEWSSAKWKELFCSIQADKLAEKARSEGKNITEQVKQLILDMPVCWSSTYGMLHHALTLREVSGIK